MTENARGVDRGTLPLLWYDSFAGLALERCQRKLIKICNISQVGGTRVRLCIFCVLLSLFAGVFSLLSFFLFFFCLFFFFLCFLFFYS